jgi:hypothetical protein
VYDVLVYNLAGYVVITGDLNIIDSTSLQDVLDKGPLKPLNQVKLNLDVISTSKFVSDSPALH